jgi:hypothetical protein
VKAKCEYGAKREDRVKSIRRAVYAADPAHAACSTRRIESPDLPAST